MYRPQNWNCHGGPKTYTEGFHDWYNWGAGSPYNLDHVQMSFHGTESLHEVAVAMPPGGGYLIFNEPQLGGIPAAEAADRYFARYNEVKDVDDTAEVGGIGLVLIPDGGQMAYLTDFLNRLQWKNANTGGRDAKFDFYAIHNYFIGGTGYGAGPLDGNGKITCEHLQEHLVWLHGSLRNSYPTIVPENVPVWITETAPLQHLWCSTSQDVVNKFMQPLIDWLDGWGFGTGKVQKVFWFIAHYFPNDLDQIWQVGDYRNQQHYHYQCALAGANHVVNPSFDGNIDGWTTWGQGQCQLSQQGDGLPVHDPGSGLNNCLKIKCTSQGWTGCYQHIRGLEAGHTYKIYRWYKVSHGYSHVSVGLSPIDWSLYQAYHPVSATWKRVEGQFTVPADRNDVWLSLLNSPVLNDYVKYDSVVIFEVSGRGPLTELWHDEVKDLVTNPYFNENVDGWDKQSDRTEATVGTDDIGFLGGNCLKVRNIRQGYWALVWQYVPVTLALYTFDFRHKNGNDGDHARAHVNLYAMPSGNLIWGSGYLNSSAWEFKEYGRFGGPHVGFRPPAGTTHILIHLVASPDLNYYHYFDSIHLYRSGV